MRTQFLVLLLAILFISATAFVVKDGECSNKVTETRNKFKEMNRLEKAKFVKSLYTKLSETYPNVDKKKVGAFVAALLFQRVPAAKVCKMYEKIFKPENVATTFKIGQNLKKKNQLRCVLECLQDKLPAQEILRIVGKCLGEEDPLPCFAQELGEHLYECVCGCFGCKNNKKQAKVIVDDKPTCPEKVKKVRAYFAKLETPKEKRAFAKKIHTKLSEKHPNVDKRKLAGFVAVLLQKRVPAERVCQLYKRLISGKPAPFNVFKAMTKHAKAEPKQLRCVLECLQDKLPAQEILRIVGKCLGQEDPLPCFAQELGEHLYECVCGCFGCKNNKKQAKTIVDDKPTCPEKVKKVRTHFNGLKKEEKRAFVKKVYKKLSEKYPNVEKKQIGAFLAALLFKRVPAPKVCKLYKKIFKSDVEKNNDVLRCIFECLVDKLPPKEILRIVGKCFGEDEPLPCFAQELGEVLFACVSGCFGKK